MGYGLPAAVGAKAARPDATVICVDGDGCFQMTCQELATAALERLPIVVVIINNGWLGMVRQWQELFYAERYAETHLTKQVPDYAQLAEALGGGRLHGRQRGRARLDAARPRSTAAAPPSSTPASIPTRTATRWFPPARRRSTSSSCPTRTPPRRGSSDEPAHGLGRAREQAGRARARLADVRAARLQHPEPRGRADRAARHLAADAARRLLASTRSSRSRSRCTSSSTSCASSSCDPSESVERELALITVGAPPDKRARADRARRGLRRPRRRHRPRRAHVRDRRPARGARRIRGARPPARRPRARPHRADRPAPRRPASSAVKAAAVS